MTSDNVLIKVRGLKKHYNGGTIRALDGIDIDINKGDVMVVIGPSGSGKSTFLRSLNLLEEPTDGSIDVEWAWSSSISICSLTRPFWRT